MATQLPPFKSASSQMPTLNLSVGQLFIQSQLCTKPQLPPKDLNLSGQTAIITGANNGIGFAYAKLLLQHNLNHLIIAVRSEEKGNAAARQLRQTSPSTSPQIDVWRLDMGDYSSVESFTKRCETLSRIDFVILNAGMGDITFHLNKATGHEETMQVNFLSTMYLSVLLLPILKSRAPSPKPGRLTIVNSGTSMHCELPEAKASHIITALDLEVNFDGMGHYGKSKLLGQLFIDRLSQHVDPSDVIINLVDPGLTKGTGLMNKGSWLMKTGMAIGTRLVGRTQEQAASSYVDATIIKEEESHGSYIMDWKIYPFGFYYYTEEGKSVQDRIWREIMDEFAFAHMEEIIHSLKN
ncbi:WW domain protein [Fusarium sp. NRRL 52700]|nr:WW domain protein [Fusarium sp. NRRL 52700]